MKVWPRIPVIASKPEALDAFDDEVLDALRSSFGKELSSVHKALEDTTSQAAIDLTWQRTERHVLPMLMAGAALGANYDEAQQFAIFGSETFSVPVLLFDDYVDKKADREQFLLPIFGWIYDGHAKLAQLPKGDLLISTISAKYAATVSSAIAEKTFLYTLPQKGNSPARSDCGFLGAGIDAMFIIAQGRRADSSLQKASRIFGDLRQYCDEIADVEEDLGQGLVTRPVMLAKYDALSSNTSAFWSGKQSFAEFAKRVGMEGGYQRAFSEAENLYRKGLRQLETLEGPEKNVGDTMRPFFDLKYCLLLRLQANGWQDNRKLA